MMIIITITIIVIVLIINKNSKNGKNNNSIRGKLYFWNVSPFSVGRDSLVDIAIHYGTDGPGIESHWGRGFPQPFRPTPGSIQPPAQWISFPGINRPERGIDHTPPSSARLKKKKRHISTTVWVFMACHRVNFAFHASVCTNSVYNFKPFVKSS